jgi:predicted Fe-Mo cluster-binding NifX family protein
MKIAFPLLNEKELAIDFVHSSYIGIYDDTDSKTNLIPLSGLEKNLGITLFFDAITNQGLKSVASPYYSFMSLRVFKENNIETLKAISTNLDENIRHFKSMSLKPFDTYESMLGGECAKDCKSCGTSCSGN